MKNKPSDHIKGVGRLAYLTTRRTFPVGATRHFLQTVFSDKKSDIYDPEKARDEMKENVVILPGFASDAGPYEGLADRLKNVANVYAPNTLPRGLKAVLSRMSIEDQAKLLLEYLEKFEAIDRTGKKMNLVGHSNGGLMALLALKMSEETYNSRHKIGKIITMASGLRPSEDNHFGFIPGVSQWSRAIRDLRHDSPLFPAIEPYYDRVSLSLVSTKDELFSPEMMHVGDEDRAKFYNAGHFGFFGRKHIKRTATDIQDTLKEEE